MAKQQVDNFGLMKELGYFLQWKRTYDKLNVRVSSPAPVSAYRMPDSENAMTQFFNLMHCFNWESRGKMLHVNMERVLAVILYEDVVDVLLGRERAEPYINRWNIERMAPSRFKIPSRREWSDYVTQAIQMVKGDVAGGSENTRDPG